MHITLAQVMDAMHQVVKEFGPDYVYCQVVPSEDTGACRYVVDGKPDCLIGKVLHRLGVPIGDLARCDSDGGVPAGILNERLPGVTFDAQALVFMGFAQSAQDHGHSWGTAYQRALACVS